METGHILYFDQLQITDSDMLWGFLEAGYEGVRAAEKRVPDAEYTEQDVEEILAELPDPESGQLPKLIATKDFSAAAAEACYRKNILYLSWVHDAPQRGLYLKEALYETNRVFVFDRAQLARMRARGIPHVSQMPLATNVTRVSMPEMMSRDLSPYKGEISFVGNLYENPGRDAFFAALPEMARAECERVLSAKCGHWNEGSTIYRPLSQDTLSAMLSAFSTQHKELYTEEDWVYLMQTATLAQEAAMRERVTALGALAERFPVTLYTSHPEDAAGRLPKVQVQGAVSYEEEMPLVFRASKINLNLTTPSIETGVPLRVFDILGAGGFCMSNFQAEIPELLEPDREIVLFSSVEELIEKAEYYLSHDDARNRIAKRGFRKVSERYTCPSAIRRMISALS